VRVSTLQLSSFLKEPCAYSLDKTQKEITPLSKAVIKTALGNNSKALFSSLVKEFDKNLTGNETKEELISNFIKASRLKKQLSQKDLFLNSSQLMTTQVNSTFISSVSEFVLTKEDSKKTLQPISHELWINISAPPKKIIAYPLLLEMEVFLLHRQLRKIYQAEKYPVVLFGWKEQSLSISRKEVVPISEKKMSALIKMYESFTC